MWYLEDNVYLVKGITQAAIYDFNYNILYHLNKEATFFLSKVLDENYNSFNTEEIDFLNNLEKSNIITKNYRNYHKITDLYKKPEIDFVWIEITAKCNLKCIHCYDESSELATNIMSLKDFCHIIDEIKEYGINKLQIIGGEPFILGEKIFKYLNYCLGKFDYIEIFTNGTLIKDSWFKYFNKNNIRISLSVYSYNENEHNKITQNAQSFKKTNSTIRKLKENNIKYKVKNVIMANLNQDKKNTDLYTLNPEKDIVRMVGRANFKLLDKKLIQKKLITKEKLSFTLNKNFVTKIISGHNCFSKRLYFASNLRVYPCVMERRISHGNLKNNSLKEIINFKITNFNKENIKVCKNCEFRYCCFDCRPDSLTKNIDEKPWYCTYNPVSGIWENENIFIKNLIKTYNE